MVQNTGIVRYENLEEYILGSGAATGQQKENKPGDPDYVTPGYNAALCPLTPPVNNEKRSDITMKLINRGSQFLQFVQLEISPWDKRQAADSLYNAPYTLFPGQTVTLLGTSIRQVTDWIDVKLVTGEFSGQHNVKMQVAFTNSGGKKQLAEKTLGKNVGIVLSHLLIDRTVAGGANLLEITLEDLPEVSDNNIPPSADAGKDQHVTLTDGLTVQLEGTGGDSDGNVVSYHWGKILGPLPYNISNPQIANPVITGLIAGIYKFQLTVTDNKGAIGQSVVTIEVSSVVEDPNGNLVALVDSTLTAAAITQIQLFPLNGDPAVELLTNPITAAEGPSMLIPPKGRYKVYVTITGQPGAVKIQYGDTVSCQSFHGEGLYIFQDVEIGRGKFGMALTLTAGSCGDSSASDVFVKLNTTNSRTVEEAALPYGKQVTQQAQIKAAVFADIQGTTPKTANIILNYRLETKDNLTGAVDTRDYYTELVNQDSLTIGGTLSEKIYDLTQLAEDQLTVDTTTTYSLLPGAGYRII
ncbi:PKD domain-containing protein [Chitinophaga sp. 22321]|uniref:PKD domain-containing protein n=1 Tax=Chitinophaga hostae TaxID=2831022 RepID=A0ABS5J992_9BACT|nr:PKD domain-containing protein [Chitinophaga hostae]MBS0031618.1 PKD domain-containing protein [Chitinophaga hostae]